MMASEWAQMGPHPSFLEAARGADTGCAQLIRDDCVEAMLRQMRAELHESFRSLLYLYSLSLRPPDVHLLCFIRLGRPHLV